MKYRFLILSLLLAGVNAATVDAQEKQKASDNIFIGGGVGAMTVLNHLPSTSTFRLVNTLLRPGVSVAYLAVHGKAWRNKTTAIADIARSSAKSTWTPC